jgi:hypothetical protein
MKIAAGATILGLGGLAGFALASSPASDPPAVEPVAAKARPHTQVVRRTVHVGPKPKLASAGSAAAPPSASSAVPATAATVGNTATATATAPEPVTTSASGTTSASHADDEYDDENEVEHEEKGEDD